MATLIGQELGGYRIISQVGKGGMATVYKAFQPSLDRYVAVKVMPPYYAQEDETFIKRFKREAQSIAKLRHPNILLVIDFGEKDSLIYIVMEFVDAGTLTEILGLPVPLDQAVKIFDQIASALDYAHMQGLVHRDVKPSNILLPKPDWPLLTDFGLAKIVGGSQLTLTGTIAGTPAYMSPEQGQGESVDSRSDIYSLGIVLYEMMTGGVPYTAETPMAGVVVKHIIEPLPLPTLQNPAISEPVERVILKALAKNPDDRYQRATDLSKAFRDAVAEEVPIPDDKPTVLDQVEQEPIVETVVESADFKIPVADGVTSVDKVVTQRPPAEIFPDGMQQVESIPDVSPSKSAIVDTGLMQQRPWLKWFLPAGAAIAALCAIVMLMVFVVVPTIRDNLGTETAISSTLTAGEHMLEGHTLYESGDYSAAILAYEAAITQGEDDPEMFFSLAYSYREEGQIEKSLSVIDKVDRTYPEDAWVHATAGHFYNEIEYFYEAIAQFEIAVELEPDNMSYREALAETYQYVGEYAKAEEILGGGEKPDDQEDPEQLEEQGWELYFNRELTAAEDAFRKAVLLEPKLEGAWDGLSDVYWDQGDIEKAIGVIQEGLESNPEASYLHEKLGWLYYYIDNLDGAEQAFNNAVFYDPSASSAWEGLSDVYWYRGDIEAAIDVLETALISNPEDVYLYEKLGQLHFENWNYDAAIDALEHAISLDPEWSTAYATLAEIWFEIGDVDQGFATLLRGIEANPERSDIHETLGWYLLSYERYEDAITAFQDAIAIAPEYGWPYIGLANSYTIVGDWDGANEALINADTYSYDDPWLLESIGWGYADLGDCPTALIYFERSLAIDSLNEGAQDGLDYCGN